MAVKGTSRLRESFQQFQKDVDELGANYPNFHDDDLFVLWFLRAYLTESAEEAAKAITGGANDKGVDGLLVDDAAQAVFIVQGKYHQSLGESTEGLGTVTAFATLANLLHTWDDESVENYLAGADAGVADRLKKARKKVRDHKYSSWLYFVTTGTVTPTVRKNAQQHARQASRQCRFEVFDAHRLMLLYRDYLDGVAPPIPEVDLEVEAGGGVPVNTVAHRTDSVEEIESWVFSMRGNVLATLYEQYGRRLFARNIRGYLGFKPKELASSGKNSKSKKGARSVNAGMVSTLKAEPQRFFYFNNGVTFLCDEAKLISEQGKSILQVGNPQIINGQQTTRTLAHCSQQAGKASVLIKVMCVPRKADGSNDAFEEMVSKIVAGANWQNAIRPSDLMANDRLQIDLERTLRKMGYFYVRKRQTKGEVKQLIGNGQFFVVTKEEFAQASGGCGLDPHTIRAGLEKLFMEDHYSEVFPNSDPDYYLSRYWLMREVGWSSKGTPERAYAKWLILNFMWSQISPLVNGKKKCRAFRRQCEQQADDLIVPLSSAIDLAFKQAQRFYVSQRSTSKTDISTFYKSERKLHLRFEKFWNGIAPSQREKFDRNLMKVRDAINNYDE
jgi:hypothetical protein